MSYTVLTFTFFPSIFTSYSPSSSGSVPFSLKNLPTSSLVTGVKDSLFLSHTTKFPHSFNNSSEITCLLPALIEGGTSSPFFIVIVFLLSSGAL